MKKLIIALVISFLFPSVCFGAASTMYVTVAGAGVKDGTDWSKAFGLAEWESDCEANAETGDIYYVEAGTYTLTQDFACGNNAATTDAIKVIGVASGTTAEPPTLSDWADADNRPLIAASSYTFNLTGDYWWMMNLRGTSTDNEGLKIGDRGVMYNVKCLNSSGTSGRAGLAAYSYQAYFIAVEGISTAGDGIVMNYGTIVNSYAHDSTDCIQSGNKVDVINSVMDTCTNGFNMSSDSGMLISNNTIYNCTNGFSASTSNNNIFINNIITENTNGAVWGTAENANFWDFNIWNNDDDVTNVTQGLNAITGDPSLTEPENGDFTLSSSSSNATDSGNKLTTNQGVATDHVMNIGADQDDNAAGGGGSVTVGYSSK